MTSKIITTRNVSKPSKSRFSHLALALALSVGTVGGMVTFAAFSEPALARGAGGGGNGGGGAAGGGEGGNPAAAVNIQGPAINRAPPRRRIAAIPTPPKPCGGSADTEDTSACKYNQRPTPRIVSIHGFANCAIVQQMPGAYGRPGEFYCVRPM